MDLVPISELEAVNVMLGVIGESPVNSTVDTGSVDVATAVSILHNTSRQVQAIGWHWNLEEDYPLAATPATGEVFVPSNILKIDSMASTGLDLVRRGQRLYDRRAHSFEIGQTVPCTVVLFLAFEDLPQTAREYITIRAARIMLNRMVGSQELDGFTRYDERTAMNVLLMDEAETADYNVLTGSQSVSEVLIR